MLAFAVVPMFGSSALAMPTCSYNVAASAVGGNGSVSPTRQSVHRGRTATISINPDTGYHIGQIIDNCRKKAVANPYTIPNVRERHNVYVTFATDELTVEASVSGGHGTVSPSTQTVLYAGTASIDLTPDAGYLIATITDNGATVPIADPYVINNVTTDHEVVVTFTVDSYTVTAAVHGAHGTVDPASQPVAPGGTAAINIHADDGYEIASITDNGALMPVSSTYVITNVTGDHGVTVTFGAKVLTVTATGAGGHGTVTPPTQAVAYLDSAPVDLKPDPGYHAASITDNGVSKPVSDPYVISNVAIDHDVVATFDINQYTVTASVDGGNGSATPGTQAVVHGGTAAITSAPAGGYHLATITDNGVSMPLSSPYVIDNLAADHNVIVTFTSTSYMVAATVAGSGGSVSPTTQYVTAGNDAVINITTAGSYQVATITDNGVAKTPTTVYTITGVALDHSVVVTFVAPTYAATASPTGHGSVDPLSQDVAPGGSAVINMHPMNGYHIEAIIDGGEFKPISNPYVITNVRETHNVNVVFGASLYDINATVAGGHGSVNPPGQQVSYDGSATIDIVPGAGYHLATVVDNGTPVTPADPYVIDNVIDNHGVIATFAINEYSVDASVNGGHGSVTPAGQTVASGGTAVVNIGADTGYHITTISDNGEFVPVSNPYSITNTASDHNIVVTFAINKYTTKAEVTGGNGAVDPARQSVAYGDTTAISLQPDASFHPSSIVDNGRRMAVTNPYFIDNTEANHSVTVSFSYDQTPTYYLAEGSTDHGFSAYISIENPNAQSLNAQLTYMLPDGSTRTQTVGLPGLSQVTVNPADTLGAADFSTQVTCVQGKTIAVDRTMTWTGPGAPSPEAHSSVGVASPETTWYLPEGCSGYGFETWTLVANPNNSSTNISLIYMIEGQGPKQIDSVVPAHSRSTYSMLSDIGAQNASIEVDSSLPVVAERSMYRNDRREGSDSIGADRPATSFYLAEGSTAWGFTTYVLVQNPNDVLATVTLTCMTTNGPRTLEPFTMAPGTRKTVLMNDLIPNTDFSTEVTSDLPVIAERAMYWGAGTPAGEACHDSIGLAQPHGDFYLPDGQTSEGRETYTLVQNPNNSDVQVEIAYLYGDGTGAGYFIATVPANSRATFDMGATLASGRASIKVSCITSGMKILAERAMYWNNRGVGTDTVGNWSH